MLDNVKNMQSFHFWCQKVLPLVYDDSLSYYEVLSKVVDYLNNIIADNKGMAQQITINADNISDLQTLTQQIQQELQDILDGKAEGLYLTALKNYIDINLEAIVGRVVKFVSFGLSDDGYFMALIPSTWQFITFDTIMDPNSELYGHLTLTW